MKYLFPPTPGVMKASVYDQKHSCWDATSFVIVFFVSLCITKFSWYFGFCSYIACIVHISTMKLMLFLHFMKECLLFDDYFVKMYQINFIILLMNVMLLKPFDDNYGKYTTLPFSYVVVSTHTMYKFNKQDVQIYYRRMLIICGKYCLRCISSRTIIVYVNSHPSWA